MTEELYEIKTRTFTEAIARLVAAFKKHNPGIDSFQCECLDGSKVSIRIAKTKVSLAAHSVCCHGTEGCHDQGDKHMCRTKKRGKARA